MTRAPQVVDALIGSTLPLLLTGRSSEAPARAKGLVGASVDGISTSPGAAGASA